MFDLGLSAFSKWLAATPLSHMIQTTTWMIVVWCGILFAGRWIAYTQAG
jgi:hypothetical protein